jgi:hypothetical protein
MKAKFFVFLILTFLSFKNSYSQTRYGFNQYQLIFYAEMEQVLKQQSTSKLGLKYQLTNQFNLLFGYKNNPQQPSFGASYKSKKTKIILGTNHHRFLGFSSFVEFQFVIGQKK